jgi:hypothetical protein
VTRRGWIVFIGVPIFTILLIAVPFLRKPDLAITGIESGQTLSMADGALVVDLAFEGDMSTVDVRLNGEPIEVGADLRTVTLTDLPDGDHNITAEIDRGRFAFATSAGARFRVDSTPPSIDVLAPTAPVPPIDPTALEFQSDDPDAIVTVDGLPVDPDENGRYVVAYARPPNHSVVVTVADQFGNATEELVAFDLALPGSAGGPPVRGVHASGWTWVTPELKDPILDMIRSGQINTVEIDLKDEAGQIWYDTGVTLAHEAGAVQVLFDLEEVVDELHNMGARVIGRLVNFRDPILATHAVANGDMDWVVQTPDGLPFGQYGGFTNPFNADVVEYNIALAEEAARLGVDDILYDYVRRPDSYIETMRFPGQGDLTPEDAIVNFLELSEERVHAQGARLGASVFGIAATRPTEVAQDIPRMAQHVDYVAPMVYPSHWGPNEHGVAHPNAQPYDIVYRSIAEFVKQVEGTGATVMTWIQDFSLGIDYGPAEVRAQIDASTDAGVPDFLLWDASTTYTSGALDSR